MNATDIITAVETALDDYAATGDLEGAQQLRLFLDRTYRTVDTRFSAIEARLEGRIERAQKFERISEESARSAKRTAADLSA